MSELTISGLIVGVLFIIFITPYFMAKGVLVIGDEDFTIGRRIICMIPIVNIIYAEKKYYGSISFASITTLIAILATVTRVSVWYTAYQNVTIGTISIVAFFIGWILYVVGNIIFVGNVLRDADAQATGRRIIYTILYPFGQMFVGTNLVKLLKNRRQEDSVYGV